MTDLSKLFQNFFPNSTWDATQNIPASINENGLVLKPLLHGHEVSEVLIFDLHGKQKNMNGYADGKPRSIERCAAIFKRYADLWEKGDLHSGFGVYCLNDQGIEISVGIAGIGRSGVPGIGEYFIAELKDCRHHGLGTKISEVMLTWAKFLYAAKVAVTGKPLKIVMATTDPLNLLSQLLMSKMGFKIATDQDFKLFSNTAITPTGSKLSIINAEITPDWDRDKELPYQQLAVISDSRHTMEKALFMLPESMLKAP